MDDRIYQLAIQNQVLLVTGEGLRTICPGINLQRVPVPNSHINYQIIQAGEVTHKQSTSEGGILQGQCVPISMDVTENISGIQQAVAVSTHDLTGQVQDQILLSTVNHADDVKPGRQTLAANHITSNSISDTKVNGIGENLISTQEEFETIVPEKENGGIGLKFSAGSSSSQSFSTVPGVITIPPDIVNVPTTEVTQLVVVTPDGTERTITVNGPPEKIDIQKFLEKVCRQVGINDTVEAIVGSPQKSTEVSKIEGGVPSLLEDNRKEKTSMLLSGKLAVCHLCGYSSQDHYRCQRCRRKLPQNVKIVSIPQSSPRELKSLIVGDFKPERRKYVRRTKKNEEPVCLTISSDEEDGKSYGLNRSIKSSCAPQNSRFDSNAKESLREKEPIITETTEPLEDSLTLGIAGGGMDIFELVDSPDVESAFLQCRTVRIGSYKAVPTDKVLLTEYGIKIQVPSLKGDTTTIKILRQEIIKVLVHFGKQLPVLFYYVTAKAACRIRGALQMPNKEINTYFDPTSPEEMHKRITLLPIKISEETRLFIKTIYEPKGCLCELNSNEANEILVRAAPRDVQHHLKKEESLPPTSCHPIQIIMVYPPPPSKGGISINTEDYACLGEDQFLNDVIIDFYLKYLMQTMLTEEDQKKTHVFSSFFYKRLTTKATPHIGSGVKIIEDPKMSPAEKRHARVKGWTKSVDLFSKDFIIIPINENSHWFLGIICFPGLTSCVKMSDNTPVSTPEKKVKPKEKPKVEKKEGTVLTGGQAPATIGATTITMVNSSTGGTTITLEGDEERDEADGDDEDLEPNTSDEEEGKGPPDGELMDEATPKLTIPKPQKPPQDSIKQPCILIFDSLAGASRSRVCATLRDYLRIEYKVRHKNSTRDFSKDVVKGAVPKVPQQTNFTDCGLYVLQYVEAFFQKPITDFRMPIKQLKDWFTPEVVSRKRYEIQQLLHRLMEEQGIDINRLNLPFLGLKDGSKSENEGDEEPRIKIEGFEGGSMDEDVDEEEEEEVGLDSSGGDLGSKGGTNHTEEMMGDEEEEEIEPEEEEEELEEEEEEEDGEPNDFECEELEEEEVMGNSNHCIQLPIAKLSEEDPSLKRKSISLKEVRNPRLLKISPKHLNNSKKPRLDE